MQQQGGEHMQEKTTQVLHTSYERLLLESIEEAQRFYKLFSALKLLPQSKRKELVDIAFERINEGKSIVDMKHK